MQIDTLCATYMHGAQFQNREFFLATIMLQTSSFHQIYDTFLLLRLQHSLIKKLERVPLCPSRVLDVLKRPGKVGLSTRCLLQENLRGRFGSGRNDAEELFSSATLQFDIVRLITLHRPSLRAPLPNCGVSRQATYHCNCAYTVFAVIYRACHPLS